MALKENLPILLKESRLQDNLDESSKKCLKNLNEVIQNETVTPGGSVLSLASGVDFSDASSYHTSMSQTDSNIFGKQPLDIFQSQLTAFRTKTPIQESSIPNISGLGNIYGGFQPMGTMMQQQVVRPPSTMSDKSML